MEPMLVAMRLLFLAMWIYSIAAFVRVRNKPRDWLPPRWETFQYFGEVDRDRYQLNAGCGIVGAPLLIAGTFLIPLFIAFVQSRSN